ncbi:MAG: hypothetical protein V3S49_01645 [Thermodesulfobacteriota bacterium]
MGKKGFYIKRIFLALILILPAVQSAFAESLTREHSGGGIEIDVTLLNPGAVYSGDDLIFDVGMNTHSVPLDQYVMEELSYVRDERGRVFKALAWELPKGGGHHRFGKLKFSGKDKDDSPIIMKDDKYIEVVIKDVGGIKERVLRWELPIILGVKIEGGLL